MELFGFFLFLSAVLYLVDKNQGWPKFWKGCRALVIVAFIAVLFLSGYSHWRGRKTATEWMDYNEPVKKGGDTPDFIPASDVGIELKPWEEYCVKQIRAKYPVAYDDLSDAELMKRIQKKYPDKCPIK